MQKLWVTFLVYFFCVQYLIFELISPRFSVFSHIINVYLSEMTVGQSLWFSSIPTAHRAPIFHPASLITH